MNISNTTSGTTRFVVMGIASSLLILLAYGLGPNLGFKPITSLIVGYGLAGIPYAIIGLRLVDSKDTQPSLAPILIGLVISRLLLIWIPPLLSEDVWRYLWDGEILWAGLNPYAFAPNDSALDAFSRTAGLDQVRSQIGHAHIPTVYPPTAQLTFVAATGLGCSIIGFRLMTIAADLMCVWCLWRWLLARRMDPNRVALYAFCPVSIMETAVGSHIDTIGVAFLVVGLYATSKGKDLKAGLAIAWATGIKFVPILVCLPLWFTRKKSAAYAIALVVLIGSLFFFFFESGPKGLTSFAQHWRGNDGLFALIYALGESIWPNDGKPIEIGPQLAHVLGLMAGRTPDTPSHLIWPNELVFALAKLVCAGLLATVVLHSIWTRRSVLSFWIRTMGTLLLLSPVVHPWYLLWVLPFLVLYDKKDDYAVFVAPFLVWSCTIWLAYWPKIEYAATGNWNEVYLLKWLQYAPVLGLFMVGWYRQHRRSE